MHNRATANPSPRVNGDFGAIPYHKKNTQKKKKESATATPCPAHLKLLQGALHNFKAGRRATPPRLKLGHPDGLPTLQCPLVSLRQSLLQRKAPTVSQSQAPFTRSDSFAGNVLMFLAKPNNGVDFIFFIRRNSYFYFLRFLMLFFFPSISSGRRASSWASSCDRHPLPSALKSITAGSRLGSPFPAAKGAFPQNRSHLFFSLLLFANKNKNKIKKFRLEAQHLNA